KTRRNPKMTHRIQSFVWDSLSQSGRESASHMMGITLDELKTLCAEVESSHSGIKITMYLGSRQVDLSSIPMYRLLTLCGPGTSFTRTCLRLLLLLPPSFITESPGSTFIVNGQPITMDATMPYRWGCIKVLGD